MNKNNELNELFEEWKEKHKEEPYNSDTIPVKRIDKKSFTFDGFIFGEKTGAVLYILDESNLQESSKETNDFFWLKGAYKVKNNINKNPIPRRIEKMQKRICEQIKEIDLQDIAYMNINKRGGFGSRDDKTLWNYYNKYNTFIFREINIISPKIIVYCAGNQEIYSDLIEHKKELKCNYILNMSHPSSRNTDDKYMEEFENEVIRNGLMQK